MGLFEAAVMSILQARIDARSAPDAHRPAQKPLQASRGHHIGFWPHRTPNAIEIKVGGCDVVALKVEDVVPSGYPVDRRLTFSFAARPSNIDAASLLVVGGTTFIL
jgi:hypothetical protein